jgi:SHS2 domain-containing protein
MFELLDHTADVAVRLKSASPEELFRDASRALLSVQLDLGASEPVAARETVPLSLEAEDLEALLVDFLNELIFLFDTRRFLAARLDVARLDAGKPARLAGTLQGEPLDAARHAVRTEIKAATFHGLAIQRTPAGLEADVVFDL